MKIGLCGTMSVGKTTLVNELKKYPEFKNYNFRTERSKYLRDLGIPLNTDSTLKGQTIFLAERVSELIQENIITDRTVLDVMAFTSMSKSIPHNDKIVFEDYAKNFLQEYDYIFYISPKGIDVEDNGVRETDTFYRSLIDESIKYLGNRYNHRMKNIHEISGSTKQRINQILNIIDF
jgi:GTPase SAR1 family protein